MCWYRSFGRSALSAADLACWSNFFRFVLGADCRLFDNALTVTLTLPSGIRTKPVECIWASEIVLWKQIKARKTKKMAQIQVFVTLGAQVILLAAYPLPVVCFV